MPAAAGWGQVTDLLLDADAPALRSALEEFDAVVTLPETLAVRRRPVCSSTHAREIGTARDRIETSLERWRRCHERAAEERALDPRALDPIEISSESVAEESDQANVVLSSSC